VKQSAKTLVALPFEFVSPGENLKRSVGCLKSPFSKGGFRGIKTGLEYP
jgi:hypothetical protein